jgi:hypothetical protein
VKTQHLFCIVAAQSTQVHHVLVKDAHGRPFAVTPDIFEGDWAALRRGDAVAVEVTIEPLPQTKSAHLLAKGPQERLLAKVVGRGGDTPYVLVEGPGQRQYMVLPRCFAGNWDALKAGDEVELVVTLGELARVLSARLVGG